MQIGKIKCKIETGNLILPNHAPGKRIPSRREGGCKIHVARLI